MGERMKEFAWDASKMDSSSSLKRQLVLIYKICKSIAGFENVEKSFNDLMNLASEAIPIQVSVLVENRGSVVNTVDWEGMKLTQKHTQKHLEDVKEVALGMYGYWVPSSSFENNSVPVRDRGNLIVLPLSVYRRSVFGVFLIELGSIPNELDLLLADTLANLMAVAVDQFYTAKAEAEFREKYIQNLELQAKFRENFVSILSHDLRTPLTVAKLSADMIVRNPKREDLCLKSGALIINSMDRLDRMIRNLLDANRIRAGAPLVLEFDELELSQLVSSIVQELSTVHRNRFVVEGPREVYGYWSSDGLRRALENLLNNAVKYGSSGTPITLSWIILHKTVQISIHNEGSPIAVEDQAQLFNPHWRSPSIKNRKVAGWGLGLTLVRAVVEAHRGQLRVESSPETGTTFILDLPTDARN